MCVFSLSFPLALSLGVFILLFVVVVVVLFCSKIFLVCQITRAKIILANIKEAKQRSLFDCRFQLFYLSLLWIVFDRRFCTFWRVEDRDSKITLFVPKPHSSLSGEHSKKIKNSYYWLRHIYSRQIWEEEKICAHIKCYWVNKLLDSFFVALQYNLNCASEFTTIQINLFGLQYHVCDEMMTYSKHIKAQILNKDKNRMCLFLICDTRTNQYSFGMNGRDRARQEQKRESKKTYRNGIIIGMIKND